MYLLQQQLPNKCMYNAPRGIVLEGKLSLDALQQAFSLLINRHEALRTGFVMRHGAPQQFVMPMPAIDSRITLLHLLDLGFQQVQAALREQAMRPFDMSKPGLLRGIVAMVHADPVI